MIECTGCQQVLPENSFNYRSVDKGTRHKRCKGCQSVAAKRSYEKNKDAYKESARRLRPELRARGRAYIAEYLKTQHCVDCGNSDIRVLQFDHREPDKKMSTVGRLANSMGLLKKEIEKCDVRCANCHMIRTAEQFGWTR